MHNESDKNNYSLVAANGQPNYGVNDWEAAVLARRQDIADDFHLPTSSVPLSFVWVPYNYAAGPTATMLYQQAGNTEHTNSGGVETSDGAAARGVIATFNLLQAEQAIIDNPTNNAAWAGNFGDVSMGGFGPFYDFALHPNSLPTDGVPGSSAVWFGGGHYYTGTPFYDSLDNSFVYNDLQNNHGQTDYITRLANAITNAFSKVDGNSGYYHLDTGPTGRSATIVPDGTNQNVIVTFNMDPSAPTLSALGNLASLGAGWTVNNGSQIAAYATGVTLGGTNQIELHFSTSINSGQRLFYEGIGDGQITFADFYGNFTHNGSGWTKWNGQGAAVYDSKGFPVQVTAYGLQLDGTLSYGSQAQGATVLTDSQAPANDSSDVTAVGQDGSPLMTATLGLPADIGPSDLISAATGNTSLGGASVGQVVKGSAPNDRSGKQGWDQFPSISKTDRTASNDGTASNASTFENLPSVFIGRHGLVDSFHSVSDVRTVIFQKHEGG